MAIDIDSPGQHAAMIEKLSLPFSMLSDPDRSAAISPYELADLKDRRNLARPALVLIDPEGEEVWRWISRDFADRLPETEVLAEAQRLGLAPITQPPPATGSPEPGENAFPFEGLMYYFRGAKFASQAMGSRHRHHDPEIGDDATAYVAEMDRFMDTVRRLKQRRR